MKEKAAQKQTGLQNTGQGQGLGLEQGQGQRQSSGQVGVSSTSAVEQEDDDDEEEEGRSAMVGRGTHVSGTAVNFSSSSRRNSSSVLFEVVSGSVGSHDDTRR